MTNWQITAKTIYCDSVKDEVTIIIKKDWSSQCTGYSETVESGNASGKYRSCEGLKCDRIGRYLASLKKEEAV